MRDECSKNRVTWQDSPFIHTRTSSLLQEAGVSNEGWPIFAVSTPQKNSCDSLSTGQAV